MKTTKKFIPLLISIVLLAIVIVLKSHLIDCLSSYPQINEWGIYLFSIPIAYCFVMLFSTFNQSSLKIITIIFIGTLIPILLSSDFLLQKIAITLLGAVLTWAITKITNRE